MLIRIVRMTFQPDAVETFLEQFDDAAPQIRSFPGCRHLELWRDDDAPAVFTTYSHWTSADALDAYRESDLFRNTWATVKTLFAAQPVAHSYTVKRSAPTIEETAESPNDE